MNSTENVYQQLNDPGIYYIYEKGKLKSPPGYSRLSLNTDNNCINDPTERLYSAELTKIKETSLHKPPSLLNICINFVAKHIEYVDSLHGFPDLVGKDLFNAVVNQHRLVGLNEESAKILKVFSEAYTSLLLENLVLKNECLILENCLVLIQNCFHGLTLLDLHGCRIGDDHEMIKFIANSNCLKQVGLCHNALSDRGIQKMTTPIRIFNTGPNNLKILDLSCNPSITDKSMKYLIHFNQLIALDLSGTNITNSGIKKLEISTSLALKQEDKNKNAVLLEGCETKGWAKDVVHNWLKQKKFLKGMTVTESSEAKHFYSRKRQRIKLAQPVKERNKNNDVTPPRIPKFILRAGNLKHNAFVSNKYRSPKFSDNLQCTTRCKKIPKKKVYNLESAVDVLTQSIDDDIPNENKQKKRKRSSDSSLDISNKQSNILNYFMEEQDILSNYLVPSKSQSEYPSSLFAAMHSHEWDN